MCGGTVGSYRTLSERSERRTPPQRGPECRKSFSAYRAHPIGMRPFPARLDGAGDVCYAFFIKRILAVKSKLLENVIDFPSDKAAAAGKNRTIRKRWGRC